MNLGIAGRRPQGRRFVAVVLAAAGALATSAAQARALLTPHLPEAVAWGQVQPQSALPGDRLLDLAISLPLRNEDRLDAFLASLYDPASLNFRQYLSVDQFTTLYGPSRDDYDAVLRFAADHHLQVTGTVANRLVVDVRGRADDIERAFHVHLGVYPHPVESRSFYAPDAEPTMDIEVPVLHVTGLDDFARPVSHRVRDAGSAHPDSKPTGSGPRGNYLGSDIRAAYYGGNRLTGAGQSVGLLELGGYNMDDVNEYFSRVGQPESVPVVGVSVNGASLDCSGSCDDSEQVLDIEEAISMAPGLSNLYVYVGKHAVSVLARMAADDTAKQLSSSWGWLIASTQIDEPIFKEYAAQGQSFLDATGDYGYHLRYGVVWPADDPWVTAVGGTELVTDGPGGPWAAETGWSGSGGGPSPHAIPIPGYQLPFINAANQGSDTLRNVPDIAGVALDFFSCFDGVCVTGSGGTSYAAPLLAAFVALANEQADGEGRPPVGFLNPLLYDLGGRHRYDRQFHDIDAGNNGMFNAVTGFDLVTGFGTPNGQALIDALVRGR